jgi:RNA polymerase sigma-70 factor (ECF subfamily)
MAERPETSEIELMRRVAAGDEHAFVEIYRQKQAAIFRFALHMGGSQVLAEDVTQEVFVALMAQASQYDPARGSLTGYLYGIARKHLLRHFRRRRAQLPIEEDSCGAPNSAPVVLAEHTDPLGQLSRDETIESVRRAILALPPRYREAVVLCELQEMGYEEAASLAGCAVGTIRSRLHRGRALLARKLKRPDPLPAASPKVKPKGCLA